MFQSVDAVVTGLGSQSYICNKNVATVVYLGTQLQKPILVEGPAGVGKTELGKVLAGALGMGPNRSTSGSTRSSCFTRRSSRTRSAKFFRAPKPCEKQSNA